MSALILVIVLCVLPRASSLPWVTFTPNWNKIFVGEQISITCNEESNKPPNGKYYWYNNNLKLNDNRRTLSIKSVQMENAGKYECQLDDSEKSDPVQLHVSNDLIILQVPPVIYEGDVIKLRCYKYIEHYDLQSATFYKHGNVIQHSLNSQSSVLHLERVSLEDTGIYKCMKTVRHQVLFAETYILVKELFTWPSINVFPPILLEGDDVTLTCNTTLSPNKESTELQFAFYRETQKVWGFHSSNRYEVQSIQLGYSGKYSCDVQTATNSVKKWSPPSYIHISELLPQVNVSNISSITEGNPMAMTCETSLTSPKLASRLQFAFVKDGRRIQEFTSSNRYEIPAVYMNDSGNYTCLVRTSPNGEWKTSNIVTISIQTGSTTKKNSKHLHIIIPSAFLIILIVTALLLSMCYHKLPCAISNNHRPRSGEEDDVVYTQTRFIPNQKAVLSTTTSYDVTYAAVKTTKC